MAKTKHICPECGAQFTYGSGRGQARKYCGKECASRARLAREADASQTWPQCSERGCDRKVRSARATRCETHYYRIRRNGTVALMSETNPPAIEASHSDGYILEYVPSHPLWNGSRVYQHRRVFFDRYGKSGHRCHWCDVDLSWDGMHIDHLNDIKDDNRAENLVVSCPSCNVSRGAHKMVAKSRSRSKSKVTWRGETLTLGEWACRVGISRASMVWRIKNGWGLDRAMTEPRGVTGPR